MKRRRSLTELTILENLLHEKMVEYENKIRGVLKKYAEHIPEIQKLELEIEEIQKTIHMIK